MLPPCRSLMLPLIVDALPLKNDCLENWPMFHPLFLLLRIRPGVLIQKIDQLLPVFPHDPNGPGQFGNETRAELLNLVGVPNGESPTKDHATAITAFSIYAR
ncbi:hypothetical protein DFH11DRAFT_1232693 [Phellopilus nigrolimitatus]|nr:hypothetical protein DFH11DRAFT_1232693 [Phellopilus nigrolimitatus]